MQFNRVIISTNKMEDTAYGTVLSKHHPEVTYFHHKKWTETEEAEEGQT